MKKILLLSDTHGYIDDHIMEYVNESDEVWHAGDVGTIDVTDKISKILSSNSKKFITIPYIKNSLRRTKITTICNSC